MKAVLAVLLLALQAQQPQVRPAVVGARADAARQATGVVRGQVLSGIGGQPIPFAAVEVIGQPGVSPAVTDQGGGYLLAGIPAGQHILRASHIGHSSLDIRVLVPPGGQVEIDFALELRPVTLPAVVGRVGRPAGFMDTISVSPGTVGETSVTALESTPGMVEMGLSEVVSGSPDPIDPNDVLYVRGAAADLKLVLLDGAPVYAPFHLAGLVAPFETEVLGAADLYIGGAPARYDGGLSYILNLETRAARGDQVHMEGAVDLLSTHLRVEGPLGDGSGYMIGGRHVHGGGVAAGGDGFPYGYLDGILRLDRRVIGGGTLTATGFGNRESVRLEGDERERGTAEWGNVAGSVRYIGPIAGADAEFSIAGGRFSSGMPIIGRRQLWVSGAATRLRSTADFVHSAGNAELQYGFAYERQWLDSQAWDRASRPDSLVRETNLTGDVSGGYFGMGYAAFGRLNLRGGVRFDVFSAERAPRIAPRLSATMLLSDETALTIAAGRYHQYVRAPEAVLTSPDAEEPPPAELPDQDPLLAVARANHIVVSFDQQVLDNTRLGVEGFYKAYEGVPTDDDGQARASGMDLWVRHTGTDLQGWLGYSLAWIWTSEEFDRPADEIFAGRHLVSAGLIGRRAASSYGLRLVYGAGLPFTAIQPGLEPDGQGPALARSHDDVLMQVAEPSPLVASPDEPYFRVDAELSHSWRFDWRGQPLQVTPYLRLINGLNRRDALFYHFDAREQTEPQALAALPIIPVVGVGWVF